MFTTALLMCQLVQGSRAFVQDSLAEHLPFLYGPGYLEILGPPNGPPQ